MTSGPLLVVKRNEQEFADFVATERGFLTVLGKYEDESLTFEAYQAAFFNSQSNYRCIEKGRQTGFSFAFACEAIARTHLRSSHNSIFVSYNLEDAKEKIAYARGLYEELPLDYQKRLVTDSKTELSFASNDANRRLSRIISNPSKAPRGKKGDIYLDELAHYKNDNEVYKGSTALILRSHGQLTVCSSPLGRRGKFWEIARQEVRPYPAYVRQSIPWWLCTFFCTDVVRAALEAPQMSTAERVDRFGTRGIKEQFDSLPLEDFQEEFEVLYADETQAYFPYGLILPCTQADLQLLDDVSQLDSCTGRLLAGYDVGRLKDFAELVVLEEDWRTEKQTMRYHQAFDRVPFHEQEDALRALLTLAPIDRLSIDKTGMGIQLAENLEIEFPDTVVPEPFSTPSKKKWVTDFKIRLQKKAIALPAERRLVAQIHAIKRRITDKGIEVFEVDTSGNMKEIGHGDYFWATALASQKDRGRRRVGVPEVGCRVITGM